MSKAKPTPKHWQNIPQELKALDQWVLRRKKEPYQISGRKASTTNSKTWASYKDAVAAYKGGGFDGIGFVFTKDDPYCGIDLDHCLVDGKLLVWAEELLTMLRPCYVEISPSGKGLHVIVRAKKPGPRCKTGYGSGEVEMYAQGRYFTMTGEPWTASEPKITDGQKDVDAVYRKVFGVERKPSQKPAQPAPAATSPTEEQVLEKIRSAKNADEFECLWAGDTTGYTSASEADLALVAKLTFYTGRDPALLSSLYRRSALALVPKNRAAHRGDLTGYVDGLVAKALSSNFKTYDWDKDRKKQPPRQARPMPEGITGAALLATVFEEPRWAIHGLLPEGLTVFGGKPKTGKSYKSMALCVAVATGGVAFSCIDVEPGEAVYLALEDSTRRIQVRLRETLAQIDEGHPGLKQLHLFNTWPRIGDGGVTRLREFLGDHPEVRLVIIDTFAKIRANKKARDAEYSYQGEYAEVGALKALADEHHIALMLVHHLRKADSEDVFDQLSGTSAIGGAADTLWILKRSRGTADAELWVTGRDIEEHKLAVDRDPNTNAWRILGDAERFSYTGKQQEIIKVLEDADGPLTPQEIADRTGKEIKALYAALHSMAKQGAIISEDWGKYSSVDRDKIAKEPLFPIQAKNTKNTKIAKNGEGEDFSNFSPPSVIDLKKQQPDNTDDNAENGANFSIFSNLNAPGNEFKRFQHIMKERERIRMAKKASK